MDGPSVGQVQRAIVPNVHREHLPASRYGANPSTVPSQDISPRRVPRSTVAGGHHPTIAASIFMTISCSERLCLAFSILAVTQLALALSIARRPPSRHGTKAASKGGWLLALVPASVARCCALLLLILDLEESSGGAMPNQVAFLYSASTFFDAASSWLFYSAKLAFVMAWASRGRVGGGYLRTGILISGGYFLVLSTSVGMSLRYGDLCVKTASERDCTLSDTWQVTFHVVMVVVSLFTCIFLAHISASIPPPSPSIPQPGGMRSIAGFCMFSIACWTIFNLWGCLVAFGALPTSPSQTEIYAAVNLILSELTPAAAIAAFLYLQVISYHGNTIPPESPQKNLEELVPMLK